MEDKMKRGFLFFAAALIAVPSYLMWREALVEGWPHDYNGWLGLFMMPIFSIVALIYAIFYRRVKQFDDELQQDMYEHTRRGNVITIVLFSLMYILVGAESVVSHVVEHKPVQKWEYYAWALMAFILIVVIIIGKTDLMDKMCDRLHNFLTRKGWINLDRMIFEDMYDDEEIYNDETDE